MLRGGKGGGNNPLHEALFSSIMAGGNAGHEGSSGDVLALSQLETLADMLGVSLDDSSMYRLAWSWSCQRPLSVTKAEFMKGVKMLEASPRRAKADVLTRNSSVKAPSPEFEPCLCLVRSHLDEVDELLHKDSQQFRQFYRFMFGWVRAPETTARGLGEVGMNVETAVELWRMLFPEYKTFLQLEEWITFCTTKELFRRDAISRDLWEQLLEFTSLTRYDTYDVNDAWPSAIDDFVEYYKTQRQTSEGGS
ncbi:uncharacterized protein Tco025E_03583 [Trypanosoma conorhini]|uniref:Defective in cullin neddylation protein n=1 Tax=Trypanosoma conorhini TaxID=83891 RepID=A0A3R7L4D0_9TRYP|nr:uncharacterized protein Tco025E_03583 [Trypanosoma conorhini]RNF20853.1 hypothetical protein Tco025E_03583 [Trypanosoma conorhini]